MTREYLTNLVYRVNGAAIKVHQTLGPGLLESVYHRCMIYELQKREISYESELVVPVEYDELIFDTSLRCDFIVEGILVVELKSVEKILPIHTAQLLTYMKLLRSPIGLLINFNCNHIYTEGQKTYVNELYKLIH